jgi:hypothetical protein
MKIDFKKLIEESGEKLTQVRLAREMFSKGIFNSERSAINMIQYHQTGKAKSCDYALLKYLVERFNRKGSEILQWDETKIKDVASHIRDDAPELKNK